MKEPKVPPHISDRYAKEFRYARMLRMYDVPFAVVKAVLELPSVQLVYSWEKNNNWADQRDRFKKTYDLELIQREQRDLAEIKADEVKLYQLMQERAFEVLNDKEIKITSVKEAAMIADMGVKGEREVMSFKIAEELVSRLLAAIREEIKDPDMLKRIGVRLKSIAVGGTGVSSEDQKFLKGGE